MYIPNINKMTDVAELTQFMRQYNFATIVSCNNGMPVATHLPFIIEEREGELFLISHFAKANNHWKLLEEHSALVIFNEPHAYISPKHYDKALNVPTWNYVAIHVYGTAKLIKKEEDVFTVLNKSIACFEQEYKTQYDSLPNDYKSGLAKGIVAFEIRATSIQGKKKLRQNKNEQEQKRIIETLLASGESTEHAVAYFMQQNICPHEST